MELGQKIQQILQHYPSVYVNGLGMFKRIHQASTYDEQRNVFLPPVDYIEFDAMAIEGKSLIDYVCEENDISQSEAKDTVKQSVDALKHLLDEYGRADITQLGELIRHGEGFVFKALDLSAFRLDPVENTGENPFVTVRPSSMESDVESNSAVETDAQEGIEEIDPVGIFNAEEIVEDAPVHVIADEDIPTVNDNAVEDVIEAEEEYEKKSNGNMVWYGILGIVGLSIAGALWYMNRQAEEQKLRALNNATPQEEPISQPIVTDTMGFGTLLDTGLTQTLDNPQGLREVIIPSNHTWYIVIASRLPLEDAEEIKTQYHSKGHASVRVLPNRSNSQVANVIWDSYVTKEEADSALRYVRRNHVSDAWHTTVKK